MSLRDWKRLIIILIALGVVYLAGVERGAATCGWISGGGS